MNTKTIKLCECGCGKPAPLAQYTSTSRGWVKGQPIRFIHGHATKISSDKRPQHFWNKVSIDSKNKCWEWKCSKNNHGYGYYGRHTLAHRVAYELAYGKIPSKMCILHHCDNPACCNPSHLFLGTMKDNAQDMLAKGRNRNKVRYGMDNNKAKLTNSDIIKIRKLRAQGVTLDKVARKFKVGWLAIFNIQHRKTWKHIP